MVDRRPGSRRFTFHGFRYAEVDGWPGPVDPAAFIAVVVHSDFERTGSFSCSNELLNQLHRNVEWGMRGNFVDVPTDCPQRDERLGWTGDLQVFAPDGDVPLRRRRVPRRLARRPPRQPEPRGCRARGRALGGIRGGALGLPAAAWGDAATVVPWVLHERYDDTALLARQFDGVRGWVDFVRARAGDRNLWPEEFQLGDWLDPSAPPDQPWRAQTDAVLVASAYSRARPRSSPTRPRSSGTTTSSEEYGNLAATVRAAFRDMYVAPSGRISSDSPTAYAIAIAFDLYERPEQRADAAARLALLFEAGEHRIATGFVGTPLVLPALSAMGDTRTAYRLLTETACPSWLYPVTMGATTVWERWDSMLPDGSINPGEMTSFNHYALGSVADWMHQVIGGIAPAAPGYRELRIAPVPGRGVTSAECTLRTPYGTARCRWSIDGTRFSSTRWSRRTPPRSRCSPAATASPGSSRPEPTAGTTRWVPRSWKAGRTRGSCAPERTRRRSWTPPA